MSNGLNAVMLIGNLCAAPELRYTKNGTPVMNLRLACNERRKLNDEWKDHAEFVNVVIWGKRGEALSNILEKGNRIFVQGKLRTSSYQSQDGSKRYSTEVHADEVLLLGGTPDRAHRPAREEPAPRNHGGYDQSPADDDDDVPF